jgi:hypothetical protein
MAIVTGPEGLWVVPVVEAGAAGVVDSGFGVISNELYCAGPNLRFAEKWPLLNLRKIAQHGQASRQFSQVDERGSVPHSSHGFVAR